ncbi:MAG: protein kinase, partial [Myxococcota bacterium]
MPATPVAPATLVLAAKRLAARKAPRPSLARPSRIDATAGTVRDVIAEHALGHYSEGLRQHLAIELGDREAAHLAFARLQERVAEVGVDALVAPPGIRARLYRLAREVAAALRRERPSLVPEGTLALAWWRVEGPAQAGAERLRADPRAGDRGLLELRHARELTLAEIAFVLGAPEDELAPRLDAAEAEARALFAGGEGDDLPRALLEAFALERLEEELPAVDAPRVEGLVIDGRYALETHLGSGSFADVYRARDVAVEGHQVALKLLKRPAGSDLERDNALRELRLIAAVSHPSIVQFKDHGWHEDRFWFVMPWYEGESLE